jgi:hypothetical protein
MQHAWDRSGMHTRFSSGNLKEKDYAEDLGVDGKIILECISGKLGTKLSNGCT